MVQTLTSQPLYVFFLIGHDRRCLLHVDVTAYQSAASSLAPDDRGYIRGHHSKYPIHDRDRVYGADFATRLAGLSVNSIRTPVQAPRANATAERVVWSLRQECLDHILPLSERHVRSVLAEFVTYHNQDRPHQSLGLPTPVPSPRRMISEVVSRPVINGLHHVYERAA